MADGPAAILRACEAALTEARDGAPAEIREAIVGIGISSPGPVDPWRGVVLQTPNMGPGFNDVPIAASVGGALGLPAFLERDTNVAALGEMAFGAARDCSDFIYLTVSTGVGGRSCRRAASSTARTAPPASSATRPSRWTGCAVAARSATWRRSSAARPWPAPRAQAVAEGRSPYLAARAAQKGIDAIEARDIAEGEDCRRRNLPRNHGARSPRLRRRLRRLRRRAESNPDRGRRRDLGCPGRAAARSGAGRGRRHRLPNCPAAGSRSSTPNSARTSAWPAAIHS